MQDVAGLSQLVVRFYKEDIAIPCISASARWQSAEDLDSINLKDIPIMVDITRLKHQDGGFSWINIGAIEQEVLGRTHEWNGGYIVEAPWLIAKVLSLKLNNGEAARHGSDPQ
jgi:hypothetical protein